MTLPALAALLLSSALAQDPVDPNDLGVIQDDEVVVVQRLLYPKTNRVELGLSGAWAAWDRYMTTPSAQQITGVSEVCRRWSRRYSLAK